MMSQSAPALTQILSEAGSGSEAARERLWDAVYAELRRMAKGRLGGDGAARHTQTTTLVHEAYLRLSGGDGVAWANRRHFFAAAAIAMRRIIVDDARSRRRIKRGGDRRQLPLCDEQPALDDDPTIILAVHEALERLEAHDARKAEVVNLRYFAGMTEDEVAEAMELSRRTVQEQWRFAKAWLRRELSQGDTRFTEAAP